MESQILYESLTKPRCDLDKNMNRTNEKTQGNDTDTVDTETLAVEVNASVQEKNCIQPKAQTNLQSSVPAESGAAEVTNKHTSKLLEQLQTPLEITKFAPKGGIGDVGNYQELSTNTDISVSKEGSNSGNSTENDNRQMEGTSVPSFVSVQNSNLVVSTNEIKSETSSLASPTPSVSSSRSMSTSPLPSPVSSITSVPVVSSSKSSRLHKRRRRGSAWTDAETEYLMEVWAKQADIIKQKGGDESVTCAPVYRLISRSMAEQGWEKTWEQCKTRIHTLKRAYKITKDEIIEGCQTITYCRHFNKLEIICGEGSQTSPGMLALTLEQKRKQRQFEGKGKKQPVRRKLTVGENPNLAKRANNGNSLLSVVGFSQLQGQNSVSSTQSAVSVQSTPSTSTIWYPPLPSQLQQQPQQFQQLQQQPQQFQLQQQQPLLNILNQSQQSVQQPLQASVLPAAPLFPYHVTPTSGNDGTQPPSSSSTVEVNNNKINVKRETSDTKNKEESTIKQHEQPAAQWNVLSSQPSKPQTVTAPQTSTGNDLERMRLDLEMRKLEVERNKLEMEERQRREDRDHQYRMMQLLLFGLGQQNISGQESDVKHAHDNVLSRALENGLVPGGIQKANEKGLSFSEL